MYMCCNLCGCQKCCLNVPMCFLNDFKFANVMGAYVKVFNTF
jgi:hypothetical protein